MDAWMEENMNWTAGYTHWNPFSIYCIPQQIGGSNGQVELRDTVSFTPLVEEGWKKPQRIIAGNCLLIFWSIDIPHVMLRRVLELFPLAGVF